MGNFQSKKAAKKRENDIITSHFYSCVDDDDKTITAITSGSLYSQTIVPLPNWLERTVTVQKHVAGAGMVVFSVGVGINGCVVSEIKKIGAIYEDGCIKKGDFIVSIDQKTLKNKTTEQASQIIDDQFSNPGKENRVTFIKKSDAAIIYDLAAIREVEKYDSSSHSSVTSTTDSDESTDEDAKCMKEAEKTEPKREILKSNNGKSLMREGSIIGKDQVQSLLRAMGMTATMSTYMNIVCSNVDGPLGENTEGTMFPEETKECGNFIIKTLAMCESWRDEKHKIRRCDIGASRIGERPRNIVLVGATGSGKSTLIDAMMNYILKVKWEDKNRFKLVNMTQEEATASKSGQAHSQTQWITVYHIPASDETELAYTLNLVDTPGFGDTRGVERDRELGEQIKQFFSEPQGHEIDSVDGICFLVQAPLARLTPTQKYIFDGILSLFGRDVAANIFTMITFADARKPPVLASLKEAGIPCKPFFKFNNSALFPSTDNEEKEEAEDDGDDDDDDDDEDFNQMFWDLGRKSMDKFFNHLAKTSPKSLTLSAQVLRKREELYNNIQHLKKKVEEGCLKLARLETEKEIMKQHETDIKRNEDFFFEEELEEKVKIDIPQGVFVTNCVICQETCHIDCPYADDVDKHKCVAMVDGKCQVCQGNCSWEKHHSNGFMFVLETKKIKKTYYEMKKRYDQAVQLKDSQLDIIFKIDNEYKAVEKDVTNKICQARCCLSELQFTALKPDPLSDQGYLEKLIHEEKTHQKKGWEKRIKVLEDIKDDARLTAGIQETMIAPEFIARTRKSRYKID